MIISYFLFITNVRIKSVKHGEPNQPHKRKLRDGQSSKLKEENDQKTERQAAEEIALSIGRWQKPDEITKKITPKIEK